MKVSLLNSYRLAWRQKRYYVTSTKHVIHDGEYIINLCYLFYDGVGGGGWWPSVILLKILITFWNIFRVSMYFKTGICAVWQYTNYNNYHDEHTREWAPLWVNQPCNPVSAERKTRTIIQHFAPPGPLTIQKCARVEHELEIHQRKMTLDDVTNSTLFLMGLFHAHAPLEHTPNAPWGLVTKQRWL